MTIPNSWLDILPAIPLRRGVSVIVTHPTHPGRAFAALTLHSAHGSWTVHDGSGLALSLAEHIRVDLDDALGFGFALRWFGLHYRTQLPASYPGLVNDFMAGRLTEKMKVDLARAIAEVQA